MTCNEQAPLSSILKGSWGTTGLVVNFYLTTIFVVNNREYFDDKSGHCEIRTVAGTGFEPAIQGEVMR